MYFKKPDTVDMDYQNEFSKPLDGASKWGALEQEAELQLIILEKKKLNGGKPERIEGINFAVSRCKQEIALRCRKYQLGKFNITKVLKLGETSIIFAAEHSTGGCALKLYTSQCSSEVPWKELDFLRQLKHPRILPVVGAFRSYYSFLVLEECYGNLNQFVHNMSDPDRFRVGLQLMQGVEFLHSRSVVHANLSPRHLLVSGTNNILISSFSQAILLRAGEDKFVSEYLRGSPAYLNQQALKYKRYSFKTDLHSCACILFRLDTGKYLQYVEGPNQTAEFYDELIETGFPEFVNGQLRERVMLQDRVKRSNFQSILTQYINGSGSAGDFLVDPNVLQFMGHLELTFGNLDTVRLRFANYHGAFLNEVSPIPVKIDYNFADYLAALFYYDDADDTTGTELSINELGNAAGSIEEADLVTPLINAVVTGDHRKVAQLRANIRECRQKMSEVSASEAVGIYPDSSQRKQKLEHSVGEKGISNTGSFKIPYRKLSPIPRRKPGSPSTFTHNTPTSNPRSKGIQLPPPVSQFKPFSFNVNDPTNKPTEVKQNDGSLEKRAVP